jgi:hypothetical protein
MSLCKMARLAPSSAAAAVVGLHALLLLKSSVAPPEPQARSMHPRVSPIDGFDGGCGAAPRPWGDARTATACRTGVTPLQPAWARSAQTAAVVHDDKRMPLVVMTPPAAGWPEAPFGATWPEPVRRLRRRCRHETENGEAVQVPEWLGSLGLLVTVDPVAAWAWASALVGVGLLVTDTHFWRPVCAALSLNYWCAAAWIASAVSWEVGVALTALALWTRGSVLLFMDRSGSADAARQSNPFDNAIDKVHHLDPTRYRELLNKLINEHKKKYPPWEERTGHPCVDYPWDVRACKAAAGAGHLDVLKWLHKEGCPWDTESCEAAAKGGHLEVLKWLRANGCPWGARACAEAASAGHLDVLKWLHKEGCPWDTESCEAAVEGGHLEVLKWLRAKGCPWGERACALAAWDGHLDVLKWLHNEGCPWDKTSCEAAAKGGHLDVLKWLHNEGCPWDTGCIAARCGHLEMFMWLHEVGCPWNKYTYDSCLQSERRGKPDVLHYAVLHG